jgi:hypothetical protein
MINKIDLAKAWLMDLLQDHDMLESVVEFLGKKHPSHFSLSTLRRAYDKLGLVSTSVGSEKTYLTDMLAAVQARQLWDGAACISEEDVAELKAELKKSNGRIRWQWGIPSDERIETSLTELGNYHAYLSAETKRVADLMHKISRSRRKLDSQPVTTTTVTPDRFGESDGESDEMINFDKPVVAEPPTEPKPSFVSSSNARF